MPGIARWSQRRRLSQSAKRRCSSGHRCCVEERPARMKPGSNPRDRPGARWWNAPRSSSERITLRGEVREAEASVVAHPAFARSGRPVQAERARGSASRSSARTTNEVRGNWFEEGLPPPKRRREPSLDPVRSRRAAFSEARAARLVSPCRPRKGADEGEGRERFVTSSCRTRNRSRSRSVPVHRRIAEVDRTPSGSEKRATSLGRVESLVVTRSA